MTGKGWRDWLTERLGIGRARQQATAWGDAARMADGIRLYAVGDIHGELALLNSLLARIGDDIASHADRRPVLVFLGDYVDRGPDSRGVIDRLIRAPMPGAELHFLAGNHEEAMLDFLADPVANGRWLEFGGVEAMASYGVRASVGVWDRRRLTDLRDQFEERLPTSHREFLAGLETRLCYGDYAFVHAGIRPGRRLERQSRDDLLWVREPFLSSPVRHEKVIVHGHTIVDAPEIHDNRIAVDTGAYATGLLSAVVLDGTNKGFIQSRAL